MLFTEGNSADLVVAPGVSNSSKSSSGLVGGVVLPVVEEIPDGLHDPPLRGGRRASEVECVQAPLGDPGLVEDLLDGDPVGHRVLPRGVGGEGSPSKGVLRRFIHIVYEPGIKVVVHPLNRFAIPPYIPQPKFSP